MRLIIRLVLVALFRVIFTECVIFLNVEYFFVIEEDIAEGGFFFFFFPAYGIIHKLR